MKKKKKHFYLVHYARNCGVDETTIKKYEKVVSLLSKSLLKQNIKPLKYLIDESLIKYVCLPENQKEFRKNLKIIQNFKKKS